LLVLQPSDRFSSFAHALANAANIRTGFVIGPKQTDGYHFHVDDVVRVTDLLIG
jgi:hypothetical protein